MNFTQENLFCHRCGLSIPNGDEWCPRCKDQLSKPEPVTSDALEVVKDARRSVNKLDDAYNAMLELQECHWTMDDWTIINNATSAISKIRERERSRLYLEETAVIQVSKS